MIQKTQKPRERTNPIEPKGSRLAYYSGYVDNIKTAPNPYGSAASFDHNKVMANGS